MARKAYVSPFRRTRRGTRDVGKPLTETVQAKAMEAERLELSN